MKSTGKVFCRECMYFRPTGRPQPFIAGATPSPDVIRAWMQWEAKLNEAEEAEREMYQQGSQFWFKPMFYSWCQWWTDRNRDNGTTNHLGDQAVQYELTARRNKKHHCKAFTAREQE